MQRCAPGCVVSVDMACCEAGESRRDPGSSAFASRVYTCKSLHRHTYYTFFFCFGFGGTRPTGNAWRVIMGWGWGGWDLLMVVAVGFLCETGRMCSEWLML